MVWIYKETVQGGDPGDMKESKVNTYNRETETAVSASGDIISTHKEGRFPASNSEGGKAMAFNSQ